MCVCVYVCICVCIRVCVCVAMETRRDPRMLKTKKTAIETIVAGGSVLTADVKKTKKNSYRDHRGRRQCVEECAR